MNLSPGNVPLKIMLTGKNGQVGWELQRTLAPLGEVTALGREELDLTDVQQIRERVREIKPDLIVNAAAFTAVDRAEKEPELARAVNGIAPGILAEEAKKINAALIHYSTDYVFDGTKSTPYTEKDKPNPVNIYGKTKLEGERAIQAVDVPYIIFRTSWVYGTRGNNFLLTMLKLAREREELKVVNDQVSSPTWSRILAEMTSQVLSQILARSSFGFNDFRGIYHASAEGETSWFDFAKLIIGTYFESSNYDSEVRLKHLKPISTAEYPTHASRPAYSVLSNLKITKTFKMQIPGWDYTLRLALDV